MSFVSDASAKSSSLASNGGSSNLESELELYKKRFRFAVLVVAGLVTLGTGYGVGHWLKMSKSDPVTITPQAISKVSEEFEGAPQAHTNASLNENVQVSAEPIKAQVSTSSINTDAVLQTPAQHYQWLSVQVGMDRFGQPIYQQQLVPVSSSGAVAMNPISQTIAATSPRDGQIQVSQAQKPEDIASLTAQGYRVAGKPLDSVAPEEELNFDGVSAELKAAFKDAVQATENNPSAEVITATNSSVRVSPIDKLPERFRASIPPFKYLTHIYATEPSMRFIKINGRELYEGDNIGALRVIEITPEMTVFDFDGVEFSVEAMEDWPKGQG